VFVCHVHSHLVDVMCMTNVNIFYAHIIQYPKTCREFLSQQHDSIVSVNPRSKCVNQKSFHQVATELLKHVVHAKEFQSSVTDN